MHTCLYRSGFLALALFVGISTRAVAQDAAVDPISNAKNLAAGFTGCMPSDLQVSDYASDPASSVAVWKATCRGEVFVCSGIPEAARCTPIVSAQTDTPDDGLEMDVEESIFGAFSSSGALFALRSETDGAGTSTPEVSVGYKFGENALLLGFGTTFLDHGAYSLAFGPSYRRYLSPPRAHHFSPFIQGAVHLLVLNAGSPQNENTLFVPPGNSTQFGFNILAGFGAEYLVTKNIGLYAKALLEYLNGPTATTTDFDGEVLTTIVPGNVNEFGLGGSLGVSIHL